MNDIFSNLIKAATSHVASVESVAVAAASNPYPNSMVGEEREQLDQYEAHLESIEAAKDAVGEVAFEPQLVALESAGIESMSDFGLYDGALSFEAIQNSIKRGAYNVKIQVKKMISKIWSLLKSLFTFFGGTDGRLKSYGKMVKKWRNKLAAIKPKENKDGGSREVEIRDWSKLASDIEEFIQSVNITKFDSLISNVKSTKGTTKLGVLGTAMKDVTLAMIETFNNFPVVTQVKNLTVGSNDSAKYDSNTDLATAQAFEKAVNEAMDNRDSVDDMIKEYKDEHKDRDKDTMSITSAQTKLMNWAAQVENKCSADIKFKQRFDKLSKAWDKAFDTSKLDMSESENEVIASLSRGCGKLGTLIIDVRKLIQAGYKFTVSDIQGLVADMAKVTAKGTSIAA